MEKLKSLDLKFKDPKMEKEYTIIKRQNIMQDFQVTVGVIALVTLVVVIEYLTKKRWSDCILPAATIAVIFAIYCIRKPFRRYIEYLTFFALFSYILYRLFLMEVAFDKSSKTSHYFGGYTYAILQVMLISRLSKVYPKLFGIVASFVLRFGFIYGWIDPQTFSYWTIIRAIIVDIFILYYFYFEDKTQRKVFQDFCESREELLKFKELLDDSLPQSVTIIDYRTGQSFFSNKAFLNMFERASETSLVTNQNQDTTTQFTQIHNESNKPHLGLLHVDRNILNELGYLKLDLLPFPNNSINLKDLMNKLILNNFITDKTQSIQAFYTNTNQNETRSFEVKLKKIKWNRFDAVAVLLNDITDQENLIALKIASANKDKIIGTVSHELRTPLNGIIGMLELAEKKIEDSDARKFVSLSSDNAKLLLSLVNSHLDLQQISAGKFKLNPGKVNLQKVLNDVISLLQFQTSQKGISLDFYIDIDVPKYITTDENRFKQILINLIGNAIKFTSKGGIRIELKQDFEEKQMINISVNDTGIGIKNEDKIKLFTMYGRLEDGRNVNKHGVGLGLTISNVLAVLLSGKKEEKGIEVESKYGEGSKFSFKILKDITVLQEDQNLLEKTPTKEDERQDLFSEIDNERQLIEKNKSFNPYFEEFFSQNDMESKLAGYMNAKKTNMLDLNSKVRSNKSLTRGKYFSHEDLKQSNPSLNEQLDYQTQEAQLNIVKSREEFGRTNFVSIPASEKQKTILVVDDNPFNLLVTGNFVKDLGFPIKTATSGHEAIEITKNCAKEGILLKVILMDCQMPIMDGYETSQVLCQMMKTHEIPKVPIFALTANSQNQEETSKCFEAGMEGYLTKPTSMEVLYQTLIKLN